MKNIWVIIVMLICNIVSAQAGYKIVVETENIDNDVLYLKIYNGTYSSSSIIDSATINSKNKTVIFSQPKKTIGAIFRLELKSDPKTKMDLLVENNSQTTFSLTGNNLSALSAESQPNKSFLSYQRLQGNPEAKLEALKSLQKGYPTPTLNLFTALEEKRLMKLPENLSAKIAARDQFFSGINLNEKAIKLMPNMYQVLYKYTTILPINNENYKANADVLLKGQNCDSENFIFYINWIFKNLEYYSQNNLNASFKHVFNKYLNDEKCIKTNKKFYDQSVIKLNSLEAVPIGTVMPELEMQDFNNKTFTLSDIYAKSKYTFLMFFNPDCVHCQQQAPKVAEYFNTLKSNGIDIQTITFLNTDNQTDWRKFTDQYFKNGWLNLKSKDNNLDYLDKLQSYSNPNFFLLDQKGKVLLKSFREQEINNLILENSAK